MSKRVPNRNELNVKPAVARALKAYRAKSGAGRAEVADKIGTTPSAISNWENAARTPDIGDLYALAQAYEVDPAEFFAEVGRSVEESGLERAKRIIRKEEHGSDEAEKEEGGQGD